MPSTTGIELSPDSCVLVRARPARGGAEVSALHTIDRMEWPTHDVAIAATLRAVRRRKRFPRRARVVVWGLPEDVGTDNPIARASVKPVVAAGFRVQSVMSPPQALAALARTRARGTSGAAVWLALNMQGAAIAIVRGGELLYSRTFDWAYRPGVVGTKAELLQRYSLVAHLAQEVRRGMSMVRASHGVTVDSAVTCGDLPELRSLTMPLIEELDLEVETLDSTEGLASVSSTRIDRFVESAPALRLACAAATAPLPRRRLALSRPLRIAAAFAVVAGGMWAGYRYWNGSATRPAESRSAPAATPAQIPNPRATPPSAPARSTAAQVDAPLVSVPPPPAVPAAASVAPSSAPAPSAAPVAQPEDANPVPDLVPSVARSAPITRPAPAPGLPAAAPPMSFATPIQDVVKEEPKPVPLKAPLPVIDSILISYDRRLAIIGGSIVGVGDSVGPRVVVAIDRDSVVFREPSGFELRVSLRQGPRLP